MRDAVDLPRPVVFFVEVFTPLALRPVVLLALFLAVFLAEPTGIHRENVPSAVLSIR